MPEIVARLVEKGGDIQYSYMTWWKTGRCTNFKSSSRWRRGDWTMQSRFFSSILGNANQPEYFTSDTRISPKGFSHISPIYRTSGESHYERPRYFAHSIGTMNHRLHRKGVVKFSHDPAIRVVTRCMMCLVEYQKAYVPSKMYISMPKSI